MSELKDSYAFWITGIEQADIICAQLPTPASHELRVRSLYSGISRGTEMLVYRGQVPVSERLRMRGPFQEGEFNFPLKYGYINVGIVEEGPAHLLDKTVFSLFPHQTHFNIAEEAVTLLPDGLPASRAILTANMETAINALWDAQPSIGDRISVVGAGVVGLLVAYLANRITGCTVQLIDTNPDRATVAEALNIEFVTPSQAENERDLVIHTSATEQGLNAAIELAGFEARIVEMSWFGNRAATIKLGGSFHSQRLQILSSQVGHIATRQRSRWNYQRRLQLALSQLMDSRLDVLISGESDFTELPDTFRWLNTPENSALCHRIRYASS